jgi:hypothetical protein
MAVTFMGGPMEQNAGSEDRAPAFFSPVLRPLETAGQAVPQGTVDIRRTTIY